MKAILQKALPFLAALLIFIIASLAYFSPVLKGEKLFQSDIAQFRGMSKEVADFRKENDKEPYWTNRAFGGMPTYQLSAYYPYNYVKQVDLALRFLPRPADYLFLYFVGFFVLLYVLKVEWKLAILGALSFGFSTYLIIILQFGMSSEKLIIFEELRAKTCLVRKTCFGDNNTVDIFYMWTNILYE